MASQVQICNIALSLLGEPSITALDQGTPTSRACADRWDDCRDFVMASHPWNFSLTRVALAVLEDAPAFGFSYQYQLPAENLRIIKVDGESIVWKVEGTRLLCDESSINIQYLKRITNTGLYSPGFVQALGAYLAHEITERVTRKTEIKATMWDEFRSKIAEARSLDGQEGTPGQIELNDWLDAR